MEGECQPKYGTIIFIFLKKILDNTEQGAALLTVTQKHEFIVHLVKWGSVSDSAGEEHIGLKCLNVLMISKFSLL